MSSGEAAGIRELPPEFAEFRLFPARPADADSIFLFVFRAKGRMLQAPHSLRQFVVLAVISVAIGCAAQTNSYLQFGRLVSQDSSDNILWYKTPLPMGTDAFVLQPANRRFYLLACIEDQRFNRLQVSRVRTSPFVIDAAGKVWQDYPDELSFRVTATGMAEILKNLDAYDIQEPGDLNSFLLGLKFRLKVYRDLEMRVLSPSAVKMIGMPGDVPYEERVYRVSFQTSDIPVDDRLVLEVLTPGGQLLSRFHLELL